MTNAESRKLYLLIICGFLLFFCRWCGAAFAWKIQKSGMLSVVSLTKNKKRNFFEQVTLFHTLVSLNCPSMKGGNLLSNFGLFGKRTI
jgi:hypothetical protein